jgi:rhamnulokinase
MQAALRLAGADLESVGVDAWGVDYALLGESGALLDNPFTYRDARTQGMVDAAFQLAGAERIYDSTGIQVMSINTLYQLMAAARRTPRLLESAQAMVNVPDLFHFWLTGKIGCEYTIVTTTQLLDWRTRNWATGLMRDLGVPTHFLQPVHEPGTVLGALRPEVARAAGLGTVRVTAPAAHDTASAVAIIRAGARTAFISSGTWSLMGAVIDQPIVNPESARLNFTNEGGVNKTYRLLKNITGLWLLESCKRAWDLEGGHHTVTDLLAMAEHDRTAAVIDPDDPAFAAPEHMPRAIAEWCAAHDQPVPNSPGSFTRTILVSLAARYGTVARQLEKLIGHPIDTIRIVGGGCRNKLLNQLTANATGCRVLAGPAEATALGNIAIQLVGIGAIPTIEDAQHLIEHSFPLEEFHP